MIRFEWHEDVRSVLRLRGSWDRMLAGWNVDNVFLSWDWLRVWLRVYGGDGRPMIGIARDGETPIGLAPLVRTRERVTPLGPVLRSVRMLGDGPLCPDHLVVPAAPGRGDEFAGALLDELEGRAAAWDRLELRDLLGTHPVWKALEEKARARALRPIVRQRTHCPYVTLPPTWDAYLALLSRHRRAVIRRNLRRLEQSFRVEVVEPASIREVDSMMASLVRLHTKAWRERGRPGVFVSPRYLLFHRLYARRAFRSGRLWLRILRLDGQDAAVHYCFRGPGRVHAYQHGHDPAFAEYSAGTLVRIFSLRKAIDEGLAEWDFLRGSAAYKQDFAATEERRGHDLILRRGTVADRVAGVATQGRRATSRGVGRLVGAAGKQSLKRLLRLP